jgi:formiminotetrahydrofolate cyclodeaminase
MGIKINIKDIEDFELTPEVMEELLTLLDAITRLLEQ